VLQPSVCRERGEDAVVSFIPAQVEAEGSEGEEGVVECSLLACLLPVLAHFFFPTHSQRWHVPPPQRQQE